MIPGTPGNPTEQANATGSVLLDPEPKCGRPRAGNPYRSRIWPAYPKLVSTYSERAVDHALACAARRVAAHDDERAFLVHGDVHQWNALEAPGGFKLVDPDGREMLAAADHVAD